MRYSKEREAILDYISVKKTHPTALKIYDELKIKLPKLSLGTVYRNLNQLVTQGKLIRINVNDNYDRFDATTESHFHVLCLKCGKIDDIMNLETDFNNKVYESIGFKVMSHSLLLKGLCKKCLKEEKNNGIKRK